LLKLKDYISLIFETNTNFWDDLRSLHLFIGPFKYAIEQIQKDNATLFSVWSNFHTITEFYKSNTIPEIFISNIDDIIKLFQSKWYDHINDNLMDAIRLFNLEKNFKFKQESLDFIIDWGSLYITTYNLIKNICIDKIQEILLVQLNDFISRHNSFSFIDCKNEELKKMYTDQNKEYSMKLLWNSYLPLCYELSIVAIAILSICPSEACVERSFSAQADVHSEERNRLSNEVIEAEMNIKINME
jgi:hypothetical protein